MRTLRKALLVAFLGVLLLVSGSFLAPLTAQIRVTNTGFVVKLSNGVLRIEALPSTAYAMLPKYNGIPPFVPVGGAWVNIAAACGWPMVQTPLGPACSGAQNCPLECQ